MRGSLAGLLAVAATSAACVTDSSIERQLSSFDMNTHPGFSHIRQDEWAALGERHVFFGHQSVGRDIVSGMRRVMSAHPTIPLRIITSAQPEDVDGPAFIEATIGENYQPGTKDEAFGTILDRGFALKAGAIAMYKYCYVDVDHDTDPDELFRRYVDQVEAIRDRHPSVTIVHITMPLFRADTRWVDEIKNLLNLRTHTALNVKRNRYNELLRERFSGREPLFDLAMLQSTRPDGSRAYSSYRGRRTDMLAPEYTHDGGHLTDEAQDRIAERFMAFLARLSAVQKDFPEVKPVGGH